MAFWARGTLLTAAHAKWTLTTFYACCTTLMRHTFISNRFFFSSNELCNVHQTLLHAAVQHKHMARQSELSRFFVDSRHIERRQTHKILVGLHPQKQRKITVSCKCNTLSSPNKLRRRRRPKCAHNKVEQDDTIATGEKRAPC